MEKILIGFYLNRKLKNGKKKVQDFISVFLLILPIFNILGIIRFISAPTIYVTDVITIMLLAYTVVNFVYYKTSIQPNLEVENNNTSTKEVKEKNKSVEKEFDVNNLLQKRNYSNPDNTIQNKRIEQAKSTLISKRQALGLVNTEKSDNEELVSDIDVSPVEEEKEKEEVIGGGEEIKFNEITEESLQESFDEQEEYLKKIMSMTAQEEDNNVIKEKENKPETIKEKADKIRSFNDKLSELMDAPIFSQTDYSVNEEHFKHLDLEPKDEGYQGVLLNPDVSDVPDVIEQISISKTEEHLNDEANPILEETETGLIPGNVGLFSKKKKKKTLFDD